jgi:hypothetical protein
MTPDEFNDIGYLARWLMTRKQDQNFETTMTLLQRKISTFRKKHYILKWGELP